MKKIFNKFALLAGLLSIFGAGSTRELKAMDAGKKVSLSKYSDNNFSNLPMKRKKGKWRVRK